MTKEDLESIENDITNYENEIQKLQTERGTMRKAVSEAEENTTALKMKTEMEKECLRNKIEILQSTLEETSTQNSAKETDINKYEQTISDLKNDYSSLMTKYRTLEDEMEIHKKTLKKNFLMEKTIAELTKENESLYDKLRSHSNDEDYKIKSLQLQSELKEMKEKFSSISSSAEETKKELSKVSTENFEKFELINTLQRENKTKLYKLEEKENKLVLLGKEYEEMSNKLKEAEFNVRNGKALYENKHKELKKEIDKLIKSNEALKTINTELTEKLQNVEYYTKFAKASKEVLNKRDFSLLETMSRRVEEVENLCGCLKSNVDELTTENKVLRSKLSSCEHVLFYYTKDEIDIHKRRLDEESLTKEEVEDVLKIKNNSDRLIELIFTLKRDNINLQKQISEITIECNRLLRLNGNK